MPQFSFQGFKTGDTVAITANQGDNSATQSIGGWRQGLADFEISLDHSGEMVAPAGVVFAVNTFSDLPVNAEPDPATMYNHALHDISWVWGFDDAAHALPTTPLNMPDVWKDLNTAYGPKAFHVFNDPGDYTVTCSAYYKGTLLKTVTKIVSLDDPALTFAGTNTLVVSQVGDFSEKPQGAAEFSNLSAALAAYASLGAPGRLLLRAGEVFSGVSEAIGQAFPNFRIGSFGDGAKPVLQVRKPKFDEGLVHGLTFVGSAAPKGPMIYGVRFEGGWDPDYEVGRNRQSPFNMGFFETPGWFAGFHRCEFSGFEMLSAAPFFDRGSAFTIALNDSLVSNWRDYGLFSQKAPGPGRICIVGSALRQSRGAVRGSASNGSKTGLGNDHGSLRNEDAVESIFSVLETFSNTSWSGIQPQGGLRSGSNGGKNFQVTIDRYCHEGGPAFNSGSVPTKDPELGGNAVLDKVLTIGVAPYDNQFIIACGGTTIRNALFYFPNVRYLEGFGGLSRVFTRSIRGADADNLTAPIKIYNNTAVSLADDTLSYIFSGGFDIFDHFDIENNAFYAPNQPLDPQDSAIVDTATAIPGVVPQYQGLRRSIGKPFAQLTSTVSGSGGTQTFPYPDDFGQADFNTSAPRHFIKVGGWYFYAEDGDISVSFGTIEIAVTNMSGQDWAAGTHCLLGLESTEATYQSLLDDSYGSVGSVPISAPLAGSSALGAAQGDFIARDDLLRELRDNPASKGAVGTS